VIDEFDEERELNEEMQEQTELANQQLQEEIDELQATIQEQMDEMTNLTNKNLDNENTIAQYRDLVGEQQERISQGISATTEAEAAKDALLSRSSQGLSRTRDLAKRAEEAERMVLDYGLALMNERIAKQQMEQLKVMIPSGAAVDELAAFEGATLLERLASKAELAVDRLRERFAYEEVDEQLAALEAAESSSAEGGEGESGGAPNVGAKLEAMSGAARAAYPIVVLAGRLRRLQTAMDGVPAAAHRVGSVGLRRELGLYENTLDNLLSAVAMVDDDDVLTRISAEIEGGAVEKATEAVAQCMSLELEEGAGEVSLETDVWAGVPRALRTGARQQLSLAQCAAAHARVEWLRMTSLVPRAELPDTITALEAQLQRVCQDVGSMRRRAAHGLITCDDRVARALDGGLRTEVLQALGECVTVLVMLRDAAQTNFAAVQAEVASGADAGAGAGDGAALAEGGDGDGAEEGGGEAQPAAAGGGADAAAITAAMSAQCGPQLTMLLEKVGTTLNTLKDKLAVADTALAETAKTPAAKQSAPTPPWQELALGVCGAWAQIACQPFSRAAAAAAAAVSSFHPGRGVRCSCRRLPDLHTCCSLSCARAISRCIFLPAWTD
jgi:hypothetical protein